MLEAEQHGEPEAARHVAPELGAHERQHQDAEEEPVVLEVNVVDDEQPRRQHQRRRDHEVAPLLPPRGRRVDEPLQRHKQHHLARYHRRALEHHRRHPVLPHRHQLHAPVRRHPGRHKPRQHPLEVRKERRVVQRPLARVLRVPLPQRQQRRDRQPVAVHVKVRRVVRREQQHLEQRRRHPDVPQRVVVSSPAAHPSRPRLPLPLPLPLRLLLRLHLHLNLRRHAVVPTLFPLLCSPILLLSQPVLSWLSFLLSVWPQSRQIPTSPFMSPPSPPSRATSALGLAPPASPYVSPARPRPDTPGTRRRQGRR